jgi:hypothetical protein
MQSLELALWLAASLDIETNAASAPGGHWTSIKCHRGTDSEEDRPVRMRTYVR